MTNPLLTAAKAEADQVIAEIRDGITMMVDAYRAAMTTTTDQTVGIAVLNAANLARFDRIDACKILAVATAMLAEAGEPS